MKQSNASHSTSLFLQSGKIGPLRSVGSISQPPTLETIQEEHDKELQQMRAKVVDFFTIFRLFFETNGYYTNCS